MVEFFYVLSGVYLLGYFMFGAYFLMNAYNHLFKTDQMVGYAQFKGIQNPRGAVIAGGILLLLGGLSYVLAPFIGLFFSNWFILCRFALALFLIVVSIKMHAFWKETDPQKKMQEKVAFYKNMALLGAVFMTTF